MLLVAQMSLHGNSSSASKLSISTEKVQSYQVNYANLTLETTKGTQHKLSNVKQPIVILNFWASWCRPCLSEFETLKKLVDKYGPEKILVLGVNNNSENQKKEIKQTEDKLALNFESVADKDSEITSKFFINEIPASIVFHKGKVIHFENREFDFMNKKFIALLDLKLAED
ncbi:MAG: TlpA family protein disulfide reductase [Bacteriovoracaceae bacterium]|nr:TlpA family protein disulfide reductase [Bacteriovoracaceae bacterium]